MKHTINKVKTANTDQRLDSNKIILIVLIAILAITIGLRLWGIDHGLPYIYDPDEPLTVVIAGGMLANRDFNPHWFGHPGTTNIYLLVLIDLAIYIGGLLSGRFAGPQDFRAYYHADPSEIYLGGRLLNVLFAAATVIVIYFIAKQIVSRKWVWLPSLLFAISPLHIGFSKYIRSDTLLTLFIVLVVYFSLEIQHKGSLRSYIFAGICTGLGVATKYPAALVVPVVFAAHFFIENEHQRKSSNLMLYFVACAVGVIIGSPYLLLNIQTVVTDLLHESRTEHLGADGLGFFGNLIFYFRTLIESGVGWGGVGFAMVGSLIAFVRKNKKVFLLILFTIVFIGGVSILSLHWSRWVIPVIPIICILTAFGFEKGVFWLDSKIAPYASIFIQIFVLLAIVTPMLFLSIQQSKTLAGPDTRTLTREWLLQNVESEKKILMETYTPILPKDAFVFYSVNENGDLALYDPEDSYKTYFKSTGHIGDINNLNEIYNYGVDYFIIGSMYERYQNAGEKYQKKALVYSELIENSKLVFESMPDTGRVNGPPVRVYQVLKP